MQTSHERPRPACSIKEVSLGVQTQGLSWLCSKGECIHITDSPLDANWVSGDSQEWLRLISKATEASTILLSFLVFGHTTQHARSQFP